MKKYAPAQESVCRLWFKVYGVRGETLCKFAAAFEHTNSRAERREDFRLRKVVRTAE